MKTIPGANLKNERELAGVTQAELSAASGIHRVNIAQYEANRRIAMRCAQQLCAALGITVERLIGEAPAQVVAKKSPDRRGVRRRKTSGRVEQEQATSSAA